MQKHAKEYTINQQTRSGHLICGKTYRSFDNIEEKLYSISIFFQSPIFLNLLRQKFTKFISVRFNFLQLWFDLKDKRFRLPDLILNQILCDGI